VANYEWDAKKELINFHKHGFTFTTASSIWGGETVEKIDGRHDYGETRIIAAGQVEGVTLVVVYTQRGESRRIISARKANFREKAFFKVQIEKRRASPN
jgi:hypothetical protein